MIKAPTENDYNNLIAFAKKLIRKQGDFLLTEYDLVHEAIAAGATNQRKVILAAFYELNRKRSSYSFRDDISGKHAKSKAPAEVQERICALCPQKKKRRGMIHPDNEPDFEKHHYVLW